jgi:hypothetical protein
MRNTAFISYKGAIPETLGAEFRAIVARPDGSRLRNASWSCDVTDDLRAVAQQVQIAETIVVVI